MKESSYRFSSQTTPTFKLKDKIEYEMFLGWYEGTYLWEADKTHAILNKDGRLIFVTNVRLCTPKEIELTLDQIAEKFGVDVDNLKIKK